MADNKIQSLQFLRGIGAIMVVLCHTSVTTVGGYGVELFMIISGFVAMYSTEHSIEHYWKKRIIKIVPLYWMMTIATALLYCVAPQLFNTTEVSIEYLIKSLFFMPYIHSGKMRPLLQLGWTLNLEMFFYILFWCAMKISYKKRGIIVVCVTFFMMLLDIKNSLPLPFAFYTEKAVFLEFSYGIILYYLYKKYLIHVDIKYKKTANIMCWSVILAGTVGMEIIGRTDIPRGIGAGIIGMLIVGIVVACEKTFVMPKCLVYVGNISYVLYLTHIYPVRLLETLVKCPESLYLVRAVVSILFAVCCAGVWNYFVEQRVQRFLRKKLIG